MNVQQTFLHKLPSFPVSHCYTQKLIKKSKDTGSVAAASKAGRPMVLFHKTVPNIAETIEDSSKNSIRINEGFPC